MRVIVAGGRDFLDYERLSERVLHLLSAQDKVTIVCGEARGADSLGKRLAYEKGWEVLSFPADWDKYGKAAGYKRNDEMVPFGELSYKEQRLLEERYEHGEVEYFNHGIKKWYLKIDPVCHSSSVYRTKPKKEEQQMKETQPYNENSFPWYMVDSKWNAVARDSDYTSWTLYEEKPGYNGTDGLWYSNTFNGFTSLTETAQRVIGVDMSRWNDVHWEESLMLRPGYQEKEEESNCDEVTSKEEADHSVNSVKEYPVVKMKELRNYKIGDVVRLKKNGKLVEITVWKRSEDCYCCALYKVFGCYGKTKCSNFPGDVCFHKVKEE